MAKKEPTKSKPAEAPAAGKRSRAGAAVQAFIDPDIRAAVDDYIAGYNEKHDHKASLTSTLEAALKKYLAAEGYWPRKKPAKD